MKTTVHKLYPDIWEHIFPYFNANELLFSFTNITEATDDVLMNSKSLFLFRGLILDIFTPKLPEKFRLSQVSSLELHQENPLDIVEQCTVLRSLKLIGTSDWIVFILAKVSNAQLRIEKLTLITPGIGSLDKMLNSIRSISTLLRLEIYANESEERIKMSNLFIDQTNIQQFKLHSCSSISWTDLSFMLPGFLNISLLDITLFEKSKTKFFPFDFPKLSYVRLMIHELPFETLFELVSTTPILIKLRLSGLVDDEAFFNSNKWIRLFYSCPSLDMVTVKLSFSESTGFFYKRINQTALDQINLNLECLDDDDNNDYSIERYQQRWWKLSGIIMKHQVFS